MPRQGKYRSAAKNKKPAKQRKFQHMDIDPDLIEGGLINDSTGRSTRKIRKQHGIKPPKKKAKK